MTIQEQITAILEHKGWRHHKDTEYWEPPSGFEGRRNGWTGKPNLLDRQICWDVFEKDAEDGYWNELFHMCEPDDFEGVAHRFQDALDVLRAINPIWITVNKAPCEQRIEAYVRHVGKWRD